MINTVLFHYGAAVLFTVGAIGLRWLLDPWLGEDFLPLATVYGSVALSLWLGGYRPAILAAVLGYLAADYLFIDPRFEFAVNSARDFAGLVAYLISCAIIIAFGVTMRVARQRTEAGEASLQQEIARRAQAEDALRESEQQFRTFMDHSPAKAFIKDEQGRYRYVNRAMEYDSSRPVADWLDKTDADLFTPDQAEQYRAHDQAVMQSGNAGEFEETLEDQAGTRHYRTFKFPMAGRDGRPLLGGLALDITAAKQIEARLRRKNERLALLSEAAAGLLHAAEPDPMLQRLFDKIGPHLSLDVFFNYMVEDGGESLRLASSIGIPEHVVPSINRIDFGEAACGTVAQRRQPLVLTHIQHSDLPEAKLVKPLGVRVYACYPLLAGDTLLGTLSFASRTRDEFDAGELAFLQTISHYVTAAYERIRFVQQLQEDDRRKNEFLAMLAHELRNPLAPIRNAVHILKARGPKEPDLIWSRDVIERQLGQMARLLEDLLDVNRITTGRMELRKSRVTLASVVESAVETCRPLIDGGGHHLTICLPADAIYLDADPVRLAQVLVNLINNAAKYCNETGIIRLTAECQGDDVLISVKDLGIGIAADKLPHIFEMFWQGDSAAVRSQGGLGIGLSLARGLVELHGGNISVHSDGPGTGCEFMIRLPAAAAPDHLESPTEPAVDTQASTRYKIVVADDNRDSADSLAMLLKIGGHDVRSAYDGHEAIEVIEAFRPDLALLDIGMPRLNGHQVARRIREQSWGKDIMLVALTGWGQQEDRRRSLEAGFNWHIVKPVDPEALRTLLETHVPLQ